MAYFDRFKFSKHERTLLGTLTTTGERPRNLMRVTRIPHASLYLAFAQLCRRRLAIRFVKGGKIYWRKTGSLNEMGASSTTKVTVHHEIQTVRECMNQILELKDGDRITIVEGTQKDSGWFELFSKKETIALNAALSNKKIICESVLPESYFEDATPRLGKDWALSYRSRPIITYVIKKHLIASDALLITLKNKVIILYAREALAIEIENEEIVSFIKGMILLIKDGARKVIIGEDFSFR